MSISIMNGMLVLQPQTFATTGATNNNVPTASSVLLVSTTTTNDAITGVSAGINNGTLLYIVNSSLTNTLVLKHDDSGSDAENRLFNTNAADCEVPPKVVVPYKYTEGTGWIEFLFFSTDLYVQDTGFVYFGEKDTNGSIRIGIVGGDFVFQQRVAGTYTTFHSITP